MSVSSLVRGRVKLTEVNQTYRILWNHFKETTKRYVIFHSVSVQKSNTWIIYTKVYEFINWYSNCTVSYNTWIIHNKGHEYVIWYDNCRAQYNTTYNKYAQSDQLSWDCCWNHKYESISDMFSSGVVCLWVQKKCTKWGCG